MKHDGFSLLELAIVLAIIGLIAGGIVAGSSMIRSSEVRAVLIQKEEISTAVISFKNKYNEMPGDMTNATRIWGTDPNCPGDETTPSSDERTCNGDGDGTVDYFNNPGPVDSGEIHRAWQHLSNAGMIAGTYTGVQALSGEVRSFVSGQNTPEAPVADSMFAMINYGRKLSTDNYYWEGIYNTIIVFGGIGSDTRGETPNLSVAETWSIDSKIDDGKPSTGNVRPFRKNYHENCTTTNIEATAEYMLDEEGTDECTLLFLNQF